MKQLTILGLFAMVLAFASCKDDNPGFQYDPELMHYDGVNANAPVLPDGNVEAAAQFQSDAMTFYQGKKIDAISYFIYGVPSVSTLIIYGKGNGSAPGNILHQQDISADIETNKWNTIVLDDPLELPDDELWISIQFPDGENIQVLGCDAGPARTGGDWWYEESIGEWRTFRQVSGDNINWNIRASMTD